MIDEYVLTNKIIVPIQAQKEVYRVYNDRELKRRFETDRESAWFKFDTDDLLYGMLQYIATFNPTETEENRKLYITKQNLRKHKKELSIVCDCSARTINNRLQKLIACGLIEEFDLSINGTVYSCYGIVVNRDMPYQIIDREWLKYLIDTRSKNALRIYFYLLDKYLWKKEESAKYEFTIKEIRLAMGYSEKSKLIDTTISNVLQSFKREGIIDYSEYYEQMEVENKVVPVPKMILSFVAQSEEELKK